MIYNCWRQFCTKTNKLGDIMSESKHTPTSNLTYAMFIKLFPGKYLREVREEKMVRSQRNLKQFIIRESQA